MTTAIMLVEAGLGAAVLPAYIWSFARDRQIVSRPLIEPQVTRSLYLVRPESRSLSPAAEGFTKVLREHAKASIARVTRR